MSHRSQRDSLVISQIIVVKQGKLSRSFVSARFIRDTSGHSPRLYNSSVQLHLSSPKRTDLANRITLKSAVPSENSFKPSALYAINFEFILISSVIISTCFEFKKKKEELIQYRSNIKRLWIQKR